jgi:hypothetical protein
MFGSRFLVRGSRFAGTNPEQRTPNTEPNREGEHEPSTENREA